MTRAASNFRIWWRAVDRPERANLKIADDIVLPIVRTPQQPTAFVASAIRANRSYLLTFVLVVAWLGAAWLALYLKRTQLLIGFDGGYMMDLARRQFEWHLPLLSASIDWFQGLGDVYFAVNFRLLPAFIVGSLFSDITTAKVFTYEVILCEISVAVLLFGLAAGASRAVSVAAALLTCVVLFPFYRPTLIFGLFPLIPNIGSVIAGTLIAAAAFLQFGRRNWLADLPYALIVLATLVWLVLVSVTILMLAAPFLLLCALSGTIAGQSFAERSSKIGLFAVTGLFLAAAGPAAYFLGAVLDTAAIVFPHELANNRASFYFASILFHWYSVGPAGPILVVLAVAGALLAAVEKTHPTLRMFAITLLTYLGTRLTFAVLVILFDFWRGPAAVYFEYFVIPLYAIFAAHFLARVFDKLRRRLHLTVATWWQPEIGLVSVAVAAMLALAIFASAPGYGFTFPPQPNAFTELLARESGLKPGSLFRGRTADMIGRSIDRNIDWLDLHALDYYLDLALDNDLRLVGLNYFGIPTLFEYTSTVSPFFYALTSRFLALPGDKQMRSVVALRNIDPRILAMLGVRFVITDREYHGPANLRATLPTKDSVLFLYEINNPNLGTYSPTVVTNLATATAIIARLGTPDFDPTHEIIADFPGDAEGLMPARNIRLSFQGATLRLEAHSDRRSILLIPLEFSRCLELIPTTAEKPLVFRANLLETGVIFSGKMEATLSLRTGPFIDPACRLWDLFDARTLRVGEVPPRLGQ
jgi:hypothetical protein